jgi:hypothetical protein
MEKRAKNQAMKKLNQSTSLSHKSLFEIIYVTKIHYTYLIFTYHIIYIISKI